MGKFTINSRHIIVLIHVENSFCVSRNVFQNNFYVLLSYQMFKINKQIDANKFQILNNHNLIEFTALKSMLAPWKALFFNFPFVFLKDSPLVSFSFQYPNLPHSSPPCPNLNLASKELSFRVSGISPIYSGFILENGFFEEELILSVILGLEIGLEVLAYLYSSDSDFY